MARRSKAATAGTDDAIYSIAKSLPLEAQADLASRLINNVIYATVYHAPAKKAATRLAGAIPAATAPTKTGKRRGRPEGSKNKPKTVTLVPEPEAPTTAGVPF